ncbi:hypothetical protein ACFYWY_10375 [Streptomyces sp. NPDC002870]|uniref:hypothetical protein n=1 Tax=Streptomyces sp. NPDC002870 TaxID=3364666 RepID=UPI003683FE81
MTGTGPRRTGERLTATTLKPYSFAAPVIGGTSPTLPRSSVHRVHRLRPVQRDDADVLASLEQHR